jgi:hypothetical protein
MDGLLILILIVVLLGGGGGYYGYRSYGPIGGLGVVLLIVVIAWVFGRGRFF